MAVGLSCTLQQFSLGFTFWSQLSDAGLSVLSGSLSSTLQQLSLSWAYCSLLSDAGWAALAGGFSSTPEQLRLISVGLFAWKSLGVPMEIPRNPNGNP